MFRSLTVLLHPLSLTVPLPERLNDPFDYAPHPFVRRAAAEVAARVESRPEWATEAATGKMFGVLVVQDTDGTAGFLAAYSGLLAGQSVTDYFVPPIYNPLTPDGHFQQEQARINALNARIALQPSRGDTLGRRLRSDRRQRSEALQEWLFSQYHCLNARGEAADIKQIFIRYFRTTMLRPEHFARNAATHHIPSGTGDCCAPKLLQYAFAHHLRPLAVGEWQTGHAGELLFRPACQERCRPLLHHMLGGLPLEPGPIARRAKDALARTTILYEDDALIALCKPGGVLSVPGRSGEPSVMDWLGEQGRAVYYPAHRLDQDASGILLVAKTAESYTRLQALFIARRVRKTYIALLDGQPQIPDEGAISLPLRANPVDRPRQMVDLAHGKAALTHYRVLSREAGSTRVELLPRTGRTHQLRLHCAHPDGLGAPIRGDRLYGSGDGNGRLCLHAAAISFTHPLTGQPITLQSPPPF